MSKGKMIVSRRGLVCQIVAELAQNRFSGWGSPVSPENTSETHLVGKKTLGELDS